MTATGSLVHPQATGDVATRRWDRIAKVVGIAKRLVLATG